MNKKIIIYLSFACACLIMFSACGGLPAENRNRKLADLGIYTFSAVDYIEQEGPRVLKPGGRGSVPGETFYYVVMESESGDYRFYEPAESLNAAMRAVNGTFGTTAPRTLEIQLYTDEDSGSNYFFDSGVDRSQALQQLQDGTYNRRESLE